jgi:hypothetical protein
MAMGQEVPFGTFRPIPVWASPTPRKVYTATPEGLPWEYGTVAQVLHVGSYNEEYLSRPEAKAPKTLIRYRVRKATGS